MFADVLAAAARNRQRRVDGQLLGADVWRDGGWLHGNCCQTVDETRVQIRASCSGKSMLDRVNDDHGGVACASPGV